MEMKNVSRYFGFLMYPSVLRDLQGKKLLLGHEGKKSAKTLQPDAMLGCQHPEAKSPGTRQT
jgi:hypothetical protein